MAQKKNSYREMNEELEKILTDLQSGELDIDAAVKSYERGAVIIKVLETYLKEAENKVKRIKTNLGKK